MPNVQLFMVRVVDKYFEDIIQFFTTGTTLEEYTSQQKKELAVCAMNLSVIGGHLYKMGSYEIL